MRYLRTYENINIKPINYKDIVAKFKIPYNDVKRILSDIKKEYKIDLLPYINDLSLLRNELSEIYSDFIFEWGIMTMSFYDYVIKYADEQWFEFLLETNIPTQLAFQRQLIMYAPKEVHKMIDYLDENIIEDNRHLFYLPPKFVSIEDNKEEVESISENVNNKYIPIVVDITLSYTNFIEIMTKLFHGNDLSFLQNDEILTCICNILRKEHKSKLASKSTRSLSTNINYKDYIQSERFGEIVAEEYPGDLLYFDELFGINKKVKDDNQYLFDSDDLGLI